MSIETGTSLQNDLTRQTALPLELWMVIFKYKNHIEYSEWEDSMRYSFSEENCTIHADEFTTLRSGRTILYNRNEASNMYNIIESCKYLLDSKFSAYHIIRFYYTLVTEYYSWFYKRSWSVNDHMGGALCVGSEWQRTWSSERLINYNSLLTALTDKVNEAGGICLQLNDSYITLNDMKREKKSYDKIEYNNICNEINTYYGSMKRFNNSVKMFKDMIYFINTYFPDWVSNKLTQCDIQFELRIYNYKDWLNFKECSKVMRNGKIVGPIITPIHFYEGS